MAVKRRRKRMSPQANVQMLTSLVPLLLFDNSHDSKEAHCLLRRASISYQQRRRKAEAGHEYPLLRFAGKEMYGLEAIEEWIESINEHSEKYIFTRKK